MRTENNTPGVKILLSKETIERLVKTYDERPDCGITLEATASLGAEVVKRNGHVVYQARSNGGDSNGS